MSESKAFEDSVMSVTILRAVPTIFYAYLLRGNAVDRVPGGHQNCEEQRSGEEQRTIVVRHPGGVTLRQSSRHETIGHPARHVSRQG